MEDCWLTTEQLAERHQVESSTVRYWRHMGTGPRGTRFGRRVKYRLSDVVAWEKDREAEQHGGQAA
jgi:DNA-binding transcriptional MerR regulator